MKLRTVSLFRRSLAHSRTRIAVAAAGALVLLGVGAGVATASIPDGNGVIHACYPAKAAAHGTHALSVIDTAKTAKCPSGDKSLNWNVTPSISSNGYSVQASDVHLNDTLTQVAQLTLPAGSFVINADAWLMNTSPTDSSSLGVCELTFGSAADEVEAGLLGPSSTPLDNQTLTMTAAATVSSASAATLSCAAEGNTGNTFDETASVTAVSVASVQS